MPLPRTLRPDIDIHVPIIGKTHCGVFRGITTRRFQVIGTANATPFAAPLAFRPPRREAGPVQLFQSGIHEFRKLTGIIALPHRRDVRHGGRRHHVALADRDTIHAQFLRRCINQAFHQIIALRPPGTAIGIHRHGIGDDTNNIGVDGAEIINACQHLGAGTGRDEGRESVQIGAHIRPILRAQRKELAILIQGQFAGGDIVTPMCVGLEGFRALRRPFHRALQLAGGEAGQHMFGIQKQLHAEAAADIGCDHAEVIFRQVEDAAGEELPHQPGTLGIGVQRPFVAAGIIICHRRAGFHAGDHDAVIHDRQARDMGGLGEKRIGLVLVADMPIKAGIIRRARPNLRLTRLGRTGKIGGGGQDLIIHLNRFRGVARGLRRFRHHKGNRVTNMAHHAFGQGRARRGRNG